MREALPWGCLISSKGQQQDNTTLQCRSPSLVHPPGIANSETCLMSFQGCHLKSQGSSASDKTGPQLYERRFCENIGLLLTKPELSRSVCCLDTHSSPPVFVSTNLRLHQSSSLAVFVRQQYGFRPKRIWQSEGQQERLRHQ